jgi:transposase
VTINREERGPDRLRDEHGFTGGITIVKDYVAGWRQRAQEMFVPLVHPPGHAQADFGEAIGIIGGVERKIHFFAFDLPHSDACFVAAYPAETTEAFCDGHVRAFAFFDGVPRSILFDNTKLAVARILGDGKRQRTRVFTELQSHYPFEDRFGRPGRLRATELPGADLSVRELRGVERPSAGMLPPSNG